MVPAPVGTPVDIAFGAALITIGAAALLVMGNGFQTGAGARRKTNGFGLPGAPDARRARDKDGNRPNWPSSDSDKKNKGK